MDVLTIALTVAGAAALINIWLSLRVSHLRRIHKVMIGDGGHEGVRARMRAHANFAEITPVFLILLALVELARGTSDLLWVAGILFILARLAHPFGMERPAPNLLRMGGVLVSWIALLALAIYALTIPYTEPRLDESIAAAVPARAQG